jgi:uncharacterized protein (TIGR01244 family)
MDGPKESPGPILLKLKILYRRFFPSRLEARSAYFNPPLIGRRLRFHAWIDMLFVDHGFIRFFYRNFHKVDEGIYRSSQPLPHHINGFARMGIRTIVNLRGGTQYGSYPLEVEAAQKAGITLVGLQLRSRDLPTVEQLEAFEQIVRQAERPLVFHCKAGADRASLASALYWLVESQDHAAAQAQLGLRYGHIKGSRTGVLDAMVETYIRDGVPAGKSFMDWVRADYHPVAIASAFKPKMLASFFGDTVLHRE